MPSFREWDLIALERKFALKPMRDSELLHNWLMSQCEIPEYEQITLGKLQDYLKTNVFHWNETELSMHFIGPMMGLVNFTTENSNLFEERELKGVVDGEVMYGYPDGMIATGFREPEKPYFFLSEYKKEKDPNGDPLGQCLAAMLTAQALNHDGIPIYGIYIVGQNWHFVILKNKEYAVSAAYSAISDDITAIYCRLCYLKGIIQQNIDHNKLLNQKN